MGYGRKGDEEVMIIVFVFEDMLDPEVLDAVETFWAEEYAEIFVEAK